MSSEYTMNIFQSQFDMFATVECRQWHGCKMRVGRVHRRRQCAPSACLTGYRHHFDRIKQCILSVYATVNKYATWITVAILKWNLPWPTIPHRHTMTKPRCIQRGHHCPLIHWRRGVRATIRLHRTPKIVLRAAAHYNLLLCVHGNGIVIE
jgi:hypothetical protein